MISVELKRTVRLVDGPSNKAGRVEIYHNGRWGSICSRGWDAKDAQVACRSVGYPDRPLE